MNKKILLIIISVILIFIVIGIGISCWINTGNDLPIKISNDVFEEMSGKYIMEEFKEEYSARLLESENKEYVTLYVETNVIESGESISIDYNNEKLLLNTANPLLENIKIERKDNISTFSIDIEALQNYSIVFIKKDVKSKIKNEDIKLY